MILPSQLRVVKGSATFWPCSATVPPRRVASARWPVRLPSMSSLEGSRRCHSADASRCNWEKGWEGSNLLTCSCFFMFSQVNSGRYFELLDFGCVLVLGALRCTAIVLQKFFHELPSFGRQGHVDEQLSDG